MHTITYLDVIIQVFLQKLTRHIRKVMPDPFDLAAIVFFFELVADAQSPWSGAQFLWSRKGLHHWFPEHVIERLQLSNFEV